MWKRCLSFFSFIFWTTSGIHDRNYRDLTSIKTTYNYLDEVEENESNSFDEKDKSVRHKRSSFYR